MFKRTIFFCVVCTLMGCTPEQNYRGVPSPLWEHLNGEQKQLVIDRAYRDDMQQAKDK